MTDRTVAKRMREYRRRLAERRRLEPSIRCIATTYARYQCRRRARVGDLCAQHHALRERGARLGLSRTVTGDTLLPVTVEATR